MKPADDARLVHEWDDRRDLRPDRDRLRIQDETLREGLQSPFVTDPGIDAKLDLLARMEGLGIDHVSVGIPAAGGRSLDDARRLVDEISRRGMRIRPNAGGRTLVDDVRQICDLVQRTGFAVDAFLFLGSSPIRQHAEAWSLALLRERTETAVAMAAAEGLEVTYILEDTTRSRPEHLEVLLATAVESGARHVCLCDTVGAATTRATANLVRWSRDLLDDLDPTVGLDWHGHDDRGLGLANALAAVEAGVNRVHATALGLGERAGNTAMEQLLVNLRLLGLDDRDLTGLPGYVAAAAEGTGVEVPHDAPVVGRDVFRTATGVHAAAVGKARAAGDTDLAERVYCAVPASWLGRRQEISVGPLSGEANVRALLADAGIEPDDDVIERILARAKRARRVLTLEEVAGVLRGEGEQDDEPVGALW